MKKILLAALLFLSLTCTGQELNTNHFQFGFQFGLGTYEMNNFKSINNEIIENLPFAAKQIDNFPPFITFQGKIIYCIKKYAVGPVIRFQSTGSRISSQDYSGSYLMDINVKGFDFGIENRYSIWERSNFALNLRGLIGIINSTSDISESLIVNEEHITSESIRTNYSNYYFEMGASYLVKLRPRFNISLDLSYMKQFGNETFFGSDYTLYGPKLSPEWNGLRAGVSLYYNLLKFK